jgi:hypothetical protein
MWRWLRTTSDATEQGDGGFGVSETYFGVGTRQLR